MEKRNMRKFAGGKTVLYKKNQTPKLETALFENPTSEYRAAPFWAWNCKLEEGLLKRQIGYFKEMGFGGFHMHSRTGMATPYLGEEFMDMVKLCVETAKEQDMLAWGYDEDRWPSGFGGGFVTKDKKNRARDLIWSKQEREGFLPKRPEGRSGESYIIGCFDVRLHEDGTLAEYKQIAPEQVAEGEKWFAYLRVSDDQSWFNNQAYVDTLYKPAIEQFCQVTHEKYKEKVGEYFDTYIPSFFTDEPKVTYKKTFNRPEDGKNLIMAWTDDFPETFYERYGEDVVAGLPELFWELPEGRISTIRYHYHRHIAERFTESYVDTIQSWCAENGIALTGHMIKEPTLKSQSTAIGEMELPLSHFGLPGIDMLGDEREYTTAKQAQSVAHQMGREGVVSELYGVTNWDFDFRRHKLGGDWQAALGVTVRAIHLSWMSMAGDSKRDYPASIHYQSPWYKEYPLLENHFARVGTAMTRGKCIVRIGMIHPVESMWLYFGPGSQTSDMRKHLDDCFQKATESLLFGQLDFDYIGESVLAEAGANEGKRLRVGEMCYDAVVVPNCMTLRSTTYTYLKKFQEAGGTLIFAGDVPEYLDGKPSKKPRELAEQSVCIPLEQMALLKALEPFSEVEILNGNGNRHEKMLYQLREDGGDRWLFTVYGRKKERYDTDGLSKIIVKMPGEWTPVLYDTMTGRVARCSYTWKQGATYVNRTLSTHDSLLLRFTKEKAEEFPLEDAIVEKERKTRLRAIDGHPVPVSLEEPNVCLLDLFEFAVDGQEYRSLEEILRIEDIVRAECRLALKGGAAYVGAQPWTFGEEKAEHTLSLRCHIESEIELNDVQLALEHSQDCTVFWNGKPVEAKRIGWYVDEQIDVIKLGQLKQGDNLLELSYPLGEVTTVEACYLLGDFGVRTEGVRFVIVPKVTHLAFGDITTQGLPFYGGNVVYHMEAETEGDGLSVHAPYFRGSLIGVSIDGERKGSIALAPYTFTDPSIKEGKHQIDLTLFGTRVNTFGALHNCNENTTWFGPPAWRSAGDSFSYEHQLKRQGILKTPEIW